MTRRKQTPPENLFPPVDEGEDFGDAPNFDVDANDPDRVDLSNEMIPEVGAPAFAPAAMGETGMFGAASGPLGVGRSTSPPIWASAHLHPSVTQLRVWKDVNGNRVLVGVIDAKANEESFIYHFFDSMPKPGEGSALFVVRPLDQLGNELREEVPLPRISDMHTTLQKIRAAKTGTGGPPQTPVIQGLDPNLVLNILSQHANQAQQAAAEERKRADAAAERAAQIQAETAARQALAVEGIADRMLQGDREAAERRARLDEERMRDQRESMSNTFTTLYTLQQTAAEREAKRDEERRREERDARDRREKEEAERRREEREERIRIEREERDARERREKEREREWEERRRREDQEREDRRRREEQEFNARVERERELRELERERAREDAKEREAQRQREHEAAMKTAELQAQRDREHMERMAQLQVQGTKTEGVEGFVTKIATVASALGFDIKGLLAPKDDTTAIETIIGVAGPALSAGISTIGEVLKAKSAERVALAQTNNGPPPPAYAFLPGATVPPPAVSPPPMLPAPNDVPNFIQTPPTQAVPVAVAPPPVVEPVSPFTPPNAGEVKLAVAKPARLALRNLLSKLRVLSEDQWALETKLALGNEGAIYHYCKVVGLKAAFNEACSGATDFVSRLLANADIQAAFPPDIPRE